MHWTLRLRRRYRLATFINFGQLILVFRGPVTQVVVNPELFFLGYAEVVLSFVAVLIFFRGVGIKMGKQVTALSNSGRYIKYLQELSVV